MPKLLTYVPTATALVAVAVRSCPFLCMQEKENAACCVRKVEIYYAEIGFVDLKRSNLNPSGSYMYTH